MIKEIWNWIVGRGDQPQAPKEVEFDNDSGDAGAPMVNGVRALEAVPKKRTTMWWSLRDLGASDVFMNYLVPDPEETDKSMREQEAIKIVNQWLGSAIENRITIIIDFKDMIYGSSELDALAYALAKAYVDNRTPLQSNLIFHNEDDKTICQEFREYFREHHTRLMGEEA